jgi:hypothetical protein
MLCWLMTVPLISGTNRCLGPLRERAAYNGAESPDDRIIEAPESGQKIHETSVRTGRD